MYTVGVRDHIQVAHSLPGEVFGAAQRLHGATYAVAVELEREELTDNGIVIEPVSFRRELRVVLDDLDHKNLDEHRAFQGKRSTTELVARHIHRELGRRLPLALSATLTVTLEGSPTTWARYRAPLPQNSGDSTRR
jgi:6-pyruvoyltetrahydropterin/6-carboxytetrahydropterin synthase